MEEALSRSLASLASLVYATPVKNVGIAAKTTAAEAVAFAQKVAAIFAPVATEYFSTRRPESCRFRRRSDLRREI